MEVLLPLLIFAGGVIYSIIASSGNKTEEKRNVDPSKMERPARSAPRRRQSESGPRQEVERRAGGMFDELKREFQSEYDKAMGRTGTESRDSNERPETGKRDEVKRRIEEQRQQLEEKRQREKEQASMRQRSRGQTYEDKKPVERRQSQRAERAKERVYTGAHNARGDVEIADAVSGIGRETAEQVRYSYGDDRTSIHERGKDKVTGGDLTFDKKAVVNGIIFSEILNRPKSRK